MYTRGCRCESSIGRYMADATTLSELFLSLSLSHHCYYFEQIVQEVQIWCAIKTHRQKGREEIKDQGGMNAGIFFQLIEFYTPLISQQHAHQTPPITAQHKISLSLQYSEGGRTGTCTSVLNGPLHAPCSLNHPRRSSKGQISLNS